MKTIYNWRNNEQTQDIKYSLTIIHAFDLNLVRACRDTCACVYLCTFPLGTCHPDCSQPWTLSQPNLRDTSLYVRIYSAAVKVIAALPRLLLFIWI